MYPDFVTCEDQPAYRTCSLISTFVSRTKHKTFCRARSGPKLSAKSLSQPLGGGGAGSSTANSISAADRMTGHVFEIKEADYQTTCVCCFKTRVARGGLWRTKADLAHTT